MNQQTKSATAPNTTNTTNTTVNPTNNTIMNPSDNTINTNMRAAPKPTTTQTYHGCNTDFRCRATFAQLGSTCIRNHRLHDSISFE